jgi:hypothetical protein
MITFNYEMLSYTLEALKGSGLNNGATESFSVRPIVYNTSIPMLSSVTRSASAFWLDFDPGFPQGIYSGSGGAWYGAGVAKSNLRSPNRVLIATSVKFSVYYVVGGVNATPLQAKVALLAYPTLSMANSTVNGENMVGISSMYGSNFATYSSDISTTTSDKFFTYEARDVVFNVLSFTMSQPAVVVQPLVQAQFVGLEVLWV